MTGYALQQADGSYPATPLNYALGSGALPLGLVSGDFNGDRKLDLAVPNSGTGNISVLLNTSIVTAQISGKVSDSATPSRGATRRAWSTS